MNTFLIITTLLVSSCSAGVRLPRHRPRLDGKIVGGQDADIENYPYQLSFEYFGSHICGASIVGESWVVTAAHCVDGISARNVNLRAGSSHKGRGGSLHQASEIIAHPKFDFYTIDSDIAVIKISSLFRFGRGIHFISLTTEEPKHGDMAVVTGWGTTSSGGVLPDQLQVVSVPIVDRSKCNESYASYGITDNMICAGTDEGGKDSCQGDSGGPLVVAGKLAGIVSWGVGCGSPGYPGVYSNVATLREFVDFHTGVY
ncbi:hypothetical protein L9F63_011260 [Diploptera punctata]|uniref:Peptidase S1 domain-containing protein n=1 Tax=Diploptera punctata TaxID=6984 RepID=A0AAD8AF05_DIPPU|nr:hypothetical protein L9F63_011260 [Diploptera punctata]